MLPRIVANADKGDVVSVQIWRGGKRRSLDVTLGNMPTEQTVAMTDSETDVDDKTPKLGLTLSGLSKEAKEHYKLSDDEVGVLIVDVNRNSPAAKHGLKRGDIITRVGRIKVTTPDEVVSEVKRAAAEEHKTVLLLVDYLAKGLTESGHAVDRAEDGKDGLFLALEGDYDVLVVDRMLPALDGLSLVQTLRSSGKATPVLILSALGDVDDRVTGLQAGGDDYLVKPFAFSELAARLEALTRRREVGTPETSLKVGDLELDLLSRAVRRAGRMIRLQPREFSLLEYLMRHVDQVVTRTMLLEGVWNYHFDPQTNVIDVHVSRLRSKIDRGFDRPLLHTVRGAGYKLSVEAS